MTNQIECAYCGACVLTVDPRTLDDTGWAAEAGRHRAGCEWVATRAHTRDDAGTRGDRIDWRDVPLCYGRSADDAEPIRRDDPRRARLLREYRDTGAIHLGWLCTPAELAELDDDAAPTAGPSVDAIDWTGIEE